MRGRPRLGRILAQTLRVLSRPVGVLTARSALWAGPVGGIVPRRSGRRPAVSSGGGPAAPSCYGWLRARGCVAWCLAHCRASVLVAPAGGAGGGHPKGLLDGGARGRFGPKSGGWSLCWRRGSPREPRDRDVPAAPPPPPTSGFVQSKRCKEGRDLFRETWHEEGAIHSAPFPTVAVPLYLFPRPIRPRHAPVVGAPKGLCWGSPRRGAGATVRCRGAGPERASPCRCQASALAAVSVRGRNSHFSVGECGELILTKDFYKADCYNCGEDLRLHAMSFTRQLLPANLPGIGLRCWGWAVRITYCMFGCRKAPSGVCLAC